MNKTELALHEKALNNAQHFQRCSAELLAIIEEVDSTKLFRQFHLASTFSYCVEILKLSEDITCIFIQVGRASRKVPELKKAVEEGLPISKARKVAKVITPENQEEWLEKAKLPHKELEKALAAENPSAHKRSSLKPSSATEFRLNVTISQETHALLERAMDILSQKSAKSASLEETLHKTLEEFVEKHDPLKKAERARKPEKPEHVVNQRDQGQCQATLQNGKICGAKKWLHVHHKIPRAEGGGDEAENLTILCAEHHRQWHAKYDARDAYAANAGHSVGDG